MLKDIASQVHRTPGAVSKIIENLAQNGMVEKKTSESNPRTVTIMSTNLGIRKRDEVMSRLDNYFGEILKAIPDGDKEVSIRVLAYIANQFPDNKPFRYSYDYHPDCGAELTFGEESNIG